jgi:large subunit ribosomal protein L25
MKEKEIVLEAEKREVKSKSAVNALRSTGKVPAVAYGDNEAPVALVLDEKSLQAVLHSERGRNTLITLKIGSSTHPVLLKEIQRHPISRAIRHVDLHRISLKSKIETSVPVHVKGEAPGVKLSGGILEHVVREIRVRCLPTEIPAAIDVDVTSLQINTGIKAKDLVVAEGVELLIEKDSIIIHVVAPTILEEVAPAAAAAAAPGTTAAEPEVIKKGKTEEGAEAASAKAPADKGAAPAAAEKKAEKK